MKLWKLLIPFCAVIIVGCASTGDTTDMDGMDGMGGDDGAATSGVGGIEGGTGSALESDRIADLMANATVYFDFDSARLDSNGQDLVAMHGAYLAENPGIKVRLEGHADERGSREYNLGLGERRAASVQSILQAQGVGASQMDIISYGEERPADPGTGEAAWAKNRRVEIVYP